MNPMGLLLERIGSRLKLGDVDPRAVRAEAWALGGRHRGRIIEGAELELRAPALPARRLSLLRAVVRSERTRARGGQ